MLLLACDLTADGPRPVAAWEMTANGPRALLALAFEAEAIIPSPFGPAYDRDGQFDADPSRWEVADRMPPFLGAEHDNPASFWHSVTLGEVGRRVTPAPHYHDGGDAPGVPCWCFAPGLPEQHRAALAWQRTDWRMFRHDPPAWPRAHYHDADPGAPCLCLTPGTYAAAPSPALDLLRPDHEPGPDCPNAPHTCLICQPKVTPAEEEDDYWLDYHYACAACSAQIAMFLDREGWHHYRGAGTAASPVEIYDAGHEAEPGGPVTFTFPGGTQVTTAAGGDIIPEPARALLADIITTLNGRYGTDWPGDEVTRLLTTLAGQLGVDPAAGLPGNDDPLASASPAALAAAAIAQAQHLTADPTGAAALIAAGTVMSPLAAVCAALTEAEQQTIVAGFTTANPHWQGAALDDILDALFDADANLAETEPLFEAHPHLVGQPGAGYAAIALARLHQPVTAGAVTGLLTRAGLA